jgi:acetyl esterase/lipase
MRKGPVPMLALIIALFTHSAAIADVQFLRSSYDLGDPSGYCLDIPGFGARMRKDAPINTHTCKYSSGGFSVDEQFEVTAKNHFRMPEYDLCLSADALEEGSHINTIDCASDQVHAWTMHSEGHVTPADARSLCLTLSADRVFVNTGIANLNPNSSRSVSLERCARGQKYFQTWKWSNIDEQDTPNANSLRAGMGTATAARIRELGNVVRARATAELYSRQARMFTAADVNISDEIAYGPDDQQRLQVYTGINRNPPRNVAPIILLVHGGGFARGGLGNFATAATHFAGLGYIAVNMTYPLAPKATWPSGVQSVASAVRWIKENAADFKGDPDNIFVLGQSAGGSLVADFVFRPDLIDGGIPDIAGAILASPVLELDPENTGESTADYFGADTGEWKNKQVLGNITRTSVPVLVLSAEFDPDRFHIATAKLLHELVVVRGVKPRIRQMRGHNHTSSLASVGTADTRAETEILDFMATANRN